jgi:LCP family protein required for cell wall assembly
MSSGTVVGSSDRPHHPRDASTRGPARCQRRSEAVAGTLRAVLTPDAQPVARHSSFAAAFLSFLLPGLGQVYCRRFLRGLFWMVPWLVAIALVAGIAFSMGLKDFAAQLADTEVMQYMVWAIFADLVWRGLSVLDAWWVARAPTGVTDGAVRRIGSVAGLVAILALLVPTWAAGAAKVEDYRTSIQCITSEIDCEDVTDSGTDNTGTGEPDESFDPMATLPPPIETTPPSFDPNASPTLAPTATPKPTPEPQGLSGNRINILLVGTNGSLTDTMIVVSIDRATKQVAFIGMPRDTVGLRIPSSMSLSSAYGGVWPTRANTIFAYTRNRSDVPGKNSRARGYGALKAIIGETLGIGIDYYVQVDMDGFMDAVNTLGGAMIDVQLPLYDSRYNSADGRGTLKLYVWPGYHFFDGGDALAYARSRHASSDFERSARQTRVITAIRNQLDIGAILEPGGIDTYLDLVRKNVRTDIPSKLFGPLADMAQGIDLDKRISLQLAPYTTSCGQASVSSSSLCTQNGRYALVANVNAMRRAVKNVFEDPAKVEKTQELAAEGAVVQVLNGTKGTNQRATRIADSLVCQGISASVPPVNGGAADRNDYEESVITVYNGGASSAPQTVKAIEKLMGVKAVEAEDPEQAATIVVTVGKGAPNPRPDCSA